MNKIYSPILVAFLMHSLGSWAQDAMYINGFAVRVEPARMNYSSVTERDWLGRTTKYVQVFYEGMNLNSPAAPPDNQIHTTATVTITYNPSGTVGRLWLARIYDSHRSDRRFLTAYSRDEKAGPPQIYDAFTNPFFLDIVNQRWVTEAEYRALSEAERSGAKKEIRSAGIVVLTI